MEQNNCIMEKNSCIMEQNTRVMERNNRMEQLLVKLAERYEIELDLDDAERQGESEA